MEKRIELVKEMRAVGQSMLTEGIHHHHHHHPGGACDGGHHPSGRLSFLNRPSTVSSFHHDDHHQRRWPSFVATRSGRRREAGGPPSPRPTGSGGESSDEDGGLEMAPIPETPDRAEGRRRKRARDDDDEEEDRLIHFTYSASEAKLKLLNKDSSSKKEENATTVSRGKLLRMHTAVEINKAIRSKSNGAQIVIVNFPAPPEKLSAGENYMEYLEVLSEGIDRVIMVRGSGKEVVTVYS